MRIEIPYGKTKQALNVPESRLRAVLTPTHEERELADQQELVRQALANPIGSAPLRELAKGKDKVVVITSDHTRPLPSAITLPLYLEEIRKGNPEADITILIATGVHRYPTEAEKRAKYGDDICDHEKLIVHDANQDENLVLMGTLPSGGELWLNKLVAEADLVVSEGFVEPHFFAGFSGGRKSVLPGVCDRTTVLGNHCGAFIASPYARTGVLDRNPLHIDMVAAARMAKLRFIVNVIIDEEKKTVAAFAGDPEAAHAAGVRFLRPYCQVDAVPADIVITSNGGAPLDQNIYQSVKGLTAAEASARKGAVLIMCAELADGTGGEGFYRSLRDCTSPADHFAQCVATPQHKTIPDQWESQILARILMKHHVIFVSRPEMEPTLREMKLDYAPTLQAAVEKARALKGDDATVTIIPNGISVIVKEILYYGLRERIPAPAR